MRADSLVILLSVAALFLLAVLGFMITTTETDMELRPGGDPLNDNDYVQVTSEIRPFFGVSVSTVVFALVVLALFALVAGVRRLRG